MDTACLTIVKLCPNHGHIAFQPTVPIRGIHHANKQVGRAEIICCGCGVLWS